MSPSTGYVADTFVAGEQPTTSKWNELWGNDASFNSGNGFNDSIIISRHLAAGLSVADKALNPYKFSVYINGAQTITSTSTQKVLYDTRNFDTNSNFDLTNHRFVAAVAGFYHLCAQVRIGATGTNIYRVDLYKNGSAIRAGDRIWSSGAADITMLANGVLQLAPNDYIEVYVTNGSGVGNGLFTGANNTETVFDGFLVSTT